MGLLFCSSPGALETLPRSAYPPATPFGTHSTSVVPSSADRMSPTGRRRVQKADIGSPQNFQHFSSGDCYRAHSQDLVRCLKGPLIATLTA